MNDQPNHARQQPSRAQPETTPHSVRIKQLRTEHDIQATWPLSLALHRESRYAKLRMNKTKRDGYLRENMVGKPDRFGMLIAEWRPAGRVVGMRRQSFFIRRRNHRILPVFLCAAGAS